MSDATKLSSLRNGTRAPRLNGPVRLSRSWVIWIGAWIKAPTAMMTIEWVTMPSTCLNVAVPPISALKTPQYSAEKKSAINGIMMNVDTRLE
jgi:hypothetical protein